MTLAVSDEDLEESGLYPRPMTNAPKDVDEGRYAGPPRAAPYIGYTPGAPATSAWVTRLVKCC